MQELRKGPESQSMSIKQSVFFFTNPSFLQESSQFIFLKLFDNLQVFHVAQSRFHLNALSILPLDLFTVLVKTVQFVNVFDKMT